MSRIPQNFIDDLLSRTDIVEVINPRVPLKKKGKEYTACCPFHNEKTPSFTVSQDKQFYYCFGCGAHGTALGFLMDYENLSFVEAIESLAQLQGLEVPYETGKFSHEPGRKSQQDGLFELLAMANKWFQDQLRASKSAIDYLKQRGLTGEISKKFEIGFAPDSWDGLLTELGTTDDKKNSMLSLGLLRKHDSGKLYDYFRGRVQFPIHNFKGQVIGFGGRIIGEDEPKYLNSPETSLFHKGKELYGLYQSRRAMREFDTVIVVEGYMDVMALYQHGVEHVVATLGTATTQEHLSRLFRMVKTIIFCFDGDRAGKDAAVKALNNTLPLIRESRTVNFMFLPEGEDPDTFIRSRGKDSFLQSVNDALKLEDFIFNYASEKSAPDSISGKIEYLEQIKPFVRQLAAGMFRSMLIQRLAKVVNMPEDRVESYIFTIKQQRTDTSKKKTGRFTRAKSSNLAHRAIAYLLAEPQLANKVENLDAMLLSKNPLIKLLVEMLQAASKANLAPAALFERFSEHPVYGDNHVKINKEQSMLGGNLEQGFVEAIQNIQSLIEKNSLSQRVSDASSGADINELIKIKNPDF